MKLPTLYQLAGEILVAQQQLLELDIPDEVVRDTLESLTAPLEEKAIAVAQMIRNMESLAGEIKKAEADQAARRKSLEKRAERVTAYLKEQLERAGVKKVPSPYFDVKIVANPPSVAIAVGSAIPNEYMRIPPIPDAEPDKKAIKAALEAGKEIPGCTIERTTRVEIK